MCRNGAPPSVCPRLCLLTLTILLGVTSPHDREAVVNRDLKVLPGEHGMAHCVCEVRLAPNMGFTLNLPILSKCLKSASAPFLPRRRKKHTKEPGPCVPSSWLTATSSLLALAA